ncbi:hypothetical protein [Verrucomicrobium spinosum]|uniref:hypothetical protein n=1 Tax=Verrucomicrobium spinosum TaxID=2736 RepID=UPI0009E9CFE7|nr:hypothetical protein [Verrucomicrobium spinosum]
MLQVKEDYDSAEPSPNSVAAMNLFRLARMLAREDLRERGAKVLRLFGKSLEESPFTVPAMVAALDFSHYGEVEIVLAGSKDDAGFQTLATAVRSRYLPHAVLLHADGGAGQAFLATRNEALGAMNPVNGQAAATSAATGSASLP